MNEQVTLQPHELAMYLPEMRPEEYESLKGDISANGQIEPILTHEGKIIDGRQRYRADQELGIEPVVAPWEGKGDPLEFVLSKNVHRRHLTSGQRAILAAEIEPRLAVLAKGRQSAAGGKKKSVGAGTPQVLPDGSKGRARDQAARLLGTNPRYVSDAKRLRSEDAGLAAKVKEGTLTLPEAMQKLDAVRQPQGHLVPEPGAILPNEPVLPATIVVGPSIPSQVAGPEYVTLPPGNGDVQPPRAQGKAFRAPVLNLTTIQTEEGVDPESGSNFITLPEWEALPESEQCRVIAEATGNRKFNNQGDNENIEWAKWSWNPVTGCRHNCPFCYARDIANRFYEQKFEPTFHPARLKAPHNTQYPADKAAQSIGHKNVFTCSMADLFGQWVPTEWIEAILAEVQAAPQWNFLFLTKFPQRMARFKFPDNAWVGTTVDCQARVKNAEKAFRDIDARVKWLSCEPLLEPLQFSDMRLFNWVVLGGASKSTQTREWYPPRAWVNDLEKAARDAGCNVYEKTNLLQRVREYPGVMLSEQTQAPEELRYLPTP